MSIGSINCEGSCMSMGVSIVRDRVCILGVSIMRDRVFLLAVSIVRDHVCL